MSPYVRVAPGVETVAQAGEVLVFDGETVFLFSGTSALVWAAVPAQRSGRDVVA